MAIKRIGVVGAGLMGSGIAEVCARSGFDVSVCEVDAIALAAGEKRIEGSLGRALSKGKLSEEDAGSIRSRLHYTSSLDDLRDSDLVIEAIVENLEVKRTVFAHLDSITGEHTILASNTSSLPIIDIAAATKRPGKVVGMHFFNPAPVMKLLELVRSVATSDETMATVNEVGGALGKTIITAKDRSGFIVNLLLIPYLVGAIRLYEAGHASAVDIDTGMKLGCGHPMGPLELLDYIGLDTTLHVCNALYEEYGNPEYSAPPLLKRMVSAGDLGRKSGRGFFDYSARSN